MKIALLSAMFPDLALEKLIPAIAAWGYDAIELNAEELPWAAPHVTPQTDVAVRILVKSVAAEHGLGISAVCAHTSLVSADPDERLAAVDYVQGCIDLAHDLDTEVVHGLTGPVPAGVAPAQAWEWAVRSVRDCADYAQRKGVMFAMEAIVNHVLFRVADMQRLLEEIDDVPLYVNFDPSHYLVGGDDIVAAVHALGHRIVHVHMKDAQGVPENFTFPSLGTGQIDFSGMMAALKEVGYSGYLSVEYEADRFGDSTPKDQAARQARSFVTELIEQVSR